MRKSLRKVLFITIISAFFALCFAICSNAASYTLTYYVKDDAREKEIYSDTETVKIRETQYSGRPKSFTQDHLAEYGKDAKGNSLYENVYTMYDGSKQTKKFFGWFTDSGELIAPGAEITLDRDMKLYEAYGFTVDNEYDLRRFFLHGWCYVQLECNITLTDYVKDDNNKIWKCSNCGYWYKNSEHDNEDPSAQSDDWRCPGCGTTKDSFKYENFWDGQLKPSWSGCTVGIVDLNGYKITSNGIADYATGDTRTGTIVISSKEGAEFNFTSKNPSNGAFNVAALHYAYGDGNQRLWVGKNVKIVSNAPLLRASNDISSRPGLPTINIWGDITAPYLVRSQGLSNVNVNIYDTAKITITGTEYPLLRDTSGIDDYEIMRLNIYGGTFTFPEGFKGLITDDEDYKECFPITIKGGTFNMDIRKYISVEYETVPGENGAWTVERNICSMSPNETHKYLATDITVTCLEDGEVDYKCDYCGDEYTSQRFALGHNTITLKISDMSNKKSDAQTVAGQYSHTCSRCGDVSYTYFFPNPKDAYINVKVKYTRNNVTKTDTIRIKGGELFGFQKDTDTEEEADTYIRSFGADIKYTFDDGTEEKFKITEIIGVEIPLGTTKIEGSIAVFRGNTHIQEITIPLSVGIVEANAFRDMPQLTNVIGIENIYDTIGDNAFAQSKDNAHLVLDTLKVNAKTIKSGAFKNVLAKRIIIGKNVKNLGDAFQLDSNISSIEASYDNNRGMLKEVFCESLANRYPLSEYPDYYSNKEVTSRTLASTYNSLSAEERVKIFVTASPSSSLLTKAPLYYDHSYAETIYAPTCLEQGYTAYECIYCQLGTKTNFVSNEGITHVWQRSPEHDIAATCAKEGAEMEYCPLCESTQKIKTIEKNNKHDFSSTELEPDYDACTKTVYYMRRRCGNGCGTWSSNAGKKMTVSEDQILGHVYSAEEDGIVQIPATCGAPGQAIKTCTRCYEQNVTESPATGVHFWVRDDSARIAPTCASAGTNFFNCKGCEATSTESIAQLTADQALEKNVHVWEEEVWIEPTKTEYGKKRIYCSLCGYVRDASANVQKLTDSGLAWWTIALIAVGGVALVGGVGATVYFAVFKKKNASKSYTYKFNTFKR